MNAHRVRLDPAAIAVEPGREATCVVRITNAGDVVDAYSVEVLGAAAVWTTVELPSISLFPGAEGSIRLTFRPPRTPDVPAGSMPFAVRVQSHDARLDTSVVEEGAIEVGRFTELGAELAPRTSHGIFSGRHSVELTNRGNAPTTVRLSGSDPERALDLAFAPREVPVWPGTTRRARLRARTVRVSMTAPPRPWAFKVVAEADATAPVELQGMMEQRPLLGRTTRRALAIGAIVLVGLAIYGIKGPDIRSAASALLNGNRTSNLTSGGSSPAASTGTSPTALPSAGVSPSPSAGVSPSPTPTSAPAPAPTTVIGSASVAPGNFDSVRVLCPAGTQAISGGIDPANVFTMVVTSSAPVYVDNGNRLIFRSDGPNPAAVGWQVSARNNDSSTQTIRAAVVCAGGYIGSTSTVVATSTQIAGGSFGVASVACPSGSVALGGGVDLDNVLTMAVTSSGPTIGGKRLLFAPAGRNAAPGGWQGSARNDSSTSMKFKIAVICSGGAASRTSSVVTSASASPGNFQAVRVLCPASAATVGGGVDIGNVFKGEVTSSAPVFTGSNPRTLTQSDGPDQAPTGWQSSGRNDDASAQPVTAAVICTTP